MIKSWQRAFFAAAMTFSIGASGSPKRILFAMVSSKRYTRWNTKLKFRIRLSKLYSLTFLPPSSTSPLFTSQKRAMRLVSVVFPPPDGPTIAVVVCSGIFRSTPSMIVLFSYKNVICFNSIPWFVGVISAPSISISGMERISFS